MRTTSWKVFLLAALASAVVAAPASPSGEQLRRVSAVQSLEVALLAEVNAVRRAHGLVPLQRSQQLAAAAGAHSRAMATRGFFAHPSPDGTPSARRVKVFYPARNYRYWSVGENLLWSSGSLDARRAVRLWLNSPGHRKNLLAPRWREVGFSAVQADAAPGTYGGRDVVIVTANFGVRR